MVHKLYMKQRRKILQAKLDRSNSQDNQVPSESRKRKKMGTAQNQKIQQINREIRIVDED